jgi:hypothetical protein
MVSSNPFNAANGANCFALRSTAIGYRFETGLCKYMIR